MKKFLFVIFLIGILYLIFQFVSEEKIRLTAFFIISLIIGAILQGDSNNDNLANDLFFNPIYDWFDFNFWHKDNSEN